MLAAEKNKLDIVTELLSRGANTDIKDEEKGQTALMIAAEKNMLDIVAMLLMKGADGKILNIAGKNALQLAQEESKEDVVRILEAWG